MMKREKFRKCFWGYVATIPFVLWTLFAIFLILKIPEVIVEPDGVGSVIGIAIIVGLVELLFVTLWLVTAFDNKYVEVVKFRITSIDIWSHTLQEYNTIFFTERIELYERYIYQWRYKIYETNQEPATESMIKGEFASYDTKEKVMKEIVKWVKDHMKHNSTKEKSGYKNIIKIPLPKMRGFLFENNFVSLVKLKLKT